MELEESVISPTTESHSSTGAFSFMLPAGYSILSVAHLFTQKSSDLFIGSTPGICGGAPIILGTRLAVHQIIEQHEAFHREKERLLKAYPHMTVQQLDAAIEYYRGHREEIEDLIEEERIAEFRE
ncbi:MAG: DUF433 domain-containing protein [Elusimicrobia bacterium]|nr:DUF433 domain-containing protein [Elusimicrobiota bacterium]